MTQRIGGVEVKEDGLCSQHEDNKTFICVPCVQAALNAAYSTTRDAVIELVAKAVDQCVADGDAIETLPAIIRAMKKGGEIQ